jgi:hypothetical protein
MHLTDTLHKIDELSEMFLCLKIDQQISACSVGWWLVADGWCWFVLRDEHCWLVAGGWFVVREKYCWLVADKPNEQGVYVCRRRH